MTITLKFTFIESITINTLEKTTLKITLKNYPIKLP